MRSDGLRGQATRYVLIGGANTAITYALFVGLGLVIPAGIAFTIAYVTGLVWVVLGSSRFVFRAQASPRMLLTFAAWYLLLYLLGQAVVQIISPKEFHQLLLTSVIVLLVTTPLSFIGGRYIFSDTKTTAKE